jgi:hypothetical protein
VRADAFISLLGAEGVRVMELGIGRIRAITHYGVTAEDVSFAAAAIARATERAYGATTARVAV